MRHSKIIVILIIIILIAAWVTIFRASLLEIFTSLITKSPSVVNQQQENGGLLIYDLGNLKAKATVIEKPFDYTAEQLQAMASECGTQFSANHFALLVEKFKDASYKVYAFEYLGGQEADQNTYYISLLPNAAGYQNFEDFKEDFNQCFVGITAAPIMLNKDWLVFDSGCSDMKVTGCELIRTAVRPTLKLQGR